jgi:hypothetical protein
MSAVPSLRHATGRRPSSGRKAAANTVVARPHLFEPAINEPRHDLNALFNVRGRPGYYNAGAKVALLRRAKKVPHDELLVDFSGSDVYIELQGAGLSLLVGNWAWEASAACQPLKAEGNWTEVLWHRENEGDYLEIEQPLSNGWKLERQMFLARKDAILLLADALLGPVNSPVEIRHSQSLPLAGEAVFEGASATREGWISPGGRRKSSVVPPALPEWRAEFVHGELCAANSRLTLQQAALGRNLYAPIWIDLDPRRSARPLTWRRLTVGENLARVPRDVAAAYRIQSGRQQWLVYRSLTRAANRSVLGHNSFSSFVCGRIEPSGETKPIVEIE